MQKQRIQVYADPQTKRRIELAAAKYDMPVTEYCMAALRQKLADDELLEAERIEIAVRLHARDDGLLDALCGLHGKILARRRGRPIDDDIVDQVRGERDHELLCP